MGSHELTVCTFYIRCDLVWSLHENLRVAFSISFSFISRYIVVFPSDFCILIRIDQKLLSIEETDSFLVALKSCTSLIHISPLLIMNSLLDSSGPQPHLISLHLGSATPSFKYNHNYHSREEKTRSI